MALQLAIDYALTIISEPGFHQHISSRKLTENLDPTTNDGNKTFWADPLTGTLMLYPLQFEKNWLNTANQLPYVIRISALTVNAADITNKVVYEFSYQQNADNPWIFHGPATPSASVPITGLTGAIGLTDLAEKTEQALGLTTFPGLSAPGAAPGASSTDTIPICYTQDNLEWNQALYLRWHVGKESAGHATVYTFGIGQFAVVCGPVNVEIYEDTSAAADRTSWRRIAQAPLFVPGASKFGNSGVTGTAQPSESGEHDRSLFWLPYRRNQVLLISPWASARFLVNGSPVLNGESGALQDWAIVQPRKMVVAALTPGPSWFQLQRVKWRDGPIDLRIPTFTIDYAPASALTGANVIDDADAFRGTTLTHGTPSQPAGYDNRANHARDDCPVTLTDGSAQSRTYGVTYTLNNAADGAGRKVFTPFLYGIDVRVSAVSGTWGVSSTTIQDTSAGGTSPIAHAMITSSLEPGEGRLEVRVHDKPPLALAPEYYRSNYPVRLFDGLTTLFTGIAEPNLIEPLRYDTNIMREVTITARDLWKWLEDTTLRDQRDWTGTGHIEVVLSVVQQAGISVAGADTPTLGGPLDTPLGGTRSQIEEITMALRPGWAPRDDPPDTAATYIKRIAVQFANFEVGFYPDGTFFYLPRNPYSYTASEVTFFKSRAANPAGPCYENPVEFENVEPEANWVQVTAQHSTDGSRIKSAPQIDYASIRNPLVVNFLGRPKTPREPLVINAAFPCPELNRIARAIWDRTRRRHLKARFTADYVPSLKVGRVCTLEGQPGTYRVLSYKAEYIQTGWAQARYEAELVESGVGLP